MTKTSLAKARKVREKSALEPQANYFNQDMTRSTLAALMPGKDPEIKFAGLHKTC